MSKLTWDNTGEKYYETGVQKGVVYPINKNTGTYPKGTAWNGLSTVEESPDGGDANDIYADNIKYASIRATENYKGSISAYSYPDEVAILDGTEAVAAGVYIGQQTRGVFGMCYRTEVGNDIGGEYYVLTLVWGATISPSERSYDTINDSPDAIEFSWDFETDPVSITVSGLTLDPSASIDIDSRYADATKLAALETVLYGSDDADARLPLPSEVITMMAVG